MCTNIFIAKRITSKEVARSCRKYDAAANGKLDQTGFETMLKKLLNTTVKEQVMSDLVNYLDPDRDNCLDYGMLVSLLAVLSDETRMEGKLKHCLRILRLRGTNYRQLLDLKGSGIEADQNDSSATNNETSSGENKKGKMNWIPFETVLDILLNFHMPILEAELLIILNKYKKDGQVDVGLFLDKMEEEAKLTSGIATVENNADNDTFSKSLFNKLCKLRSNQQKLLDFRSAILKCDNFRDGHCSKRDILKILDNMLDLTDAESGLLLENLGFYEAADRNKNQDKNLLIDYPLLLLILQEPLSNSSILQTGFTIVNKVLKGDESALISMTRDLFRLLSLEDSSENFNDERGNRRGDENSILAGYVSSATVQKIFKEDYAKVDSNLVTTLCECFKNDSNSIYYPELLCFLKCCSSRMMIRRIHSLDIIRQKQGYKFGEYLIKYVAKVGKKLDKTRLFEQFLSIGILLPNITFEMLYSNYLNSKTRLLDAEALVSAMHENVPQSNLEFGDPNTTITPRVHRRKAGNLSESKPGELTDIDLEILKAYDETIVKSAQRIFDIFDSKNNNEVSTIELDRMITSLGYKYSPDEIASLIDDIDKRKSGIMFYDSYIAVIVPFLRSKYKSYRDVSINWLRNFFESLDLNGDRILSKSEFFHVVGCLKDNAAPLTNEECQALMDYLDKDKDMSVDWAELEVAFDLLDDRAALEELPDIIQNALSKVSLKKIYFLIL